MACEDNVDGEDEEEEVLAVLASLVFNSGVDGVEVIAFRQKEAFFVFCKRNKKLLSSASCWLTTLLIFKGSLKAYKRQKPFNFHIKDLPFKSKGKCHLNWRHFYLLKVIFYRF